MTTLPSTESVTSRLPRFFVRAACGTAKAIMRVAVALKHRRDAALLLSVNDRMLADIGLTRGDVADAFSEPLWRDPTAILVSRVDERRQARRGRSPWLPVVVKPAPSIIPADDVGDHGYPQGIVPPARANAA